MRGRTELHFSEQALHDIDAISAWYESQEAWQAAIDVPKKILDAAEDLVMHPEICAVGLSGNREKVISTIPYRVVYEFEANSRRVIIYAVVHTRRQWPQGVE